MKRRSLGILLAASVAIGLIVAPASAANAASSSTVSVQLTTPKGAAWPVAGVIVSASSSKGTYYGEVETNSKGIATFKKVPGKQKLAIKALTYYSIYNYASTGRSIWPWSGHKKTVTLAVPLGAAISGTVLTTSGPLVGGQVAAVSKSGAVLRTAVTDANGKYRIRGLASGTYSIQYNNRSWADAKNPLVADAAWSYWGATGATWESAKYITVRQQGKKSSPTVKSGINGVVTAGSALTTTLSDASPDGQLNIERFVGAKRIAAESVYSPLYTPGASNVVRLLPGTYRIGVQYPATDDTFALYYYTGDNKPLSADPADAVLTSVGRAGLAIVLGSRPVAETPTPTPTPTGSPSASPVAVP